MLFLGFRYIPIPPQEHHLPFPSQNSSRIHESIFRFFYCHSSHMAPATVLLAIIPFKLYPHHITLIIILVCLFKYDPVTPIIPNPSLLSYPVSSNRSKIFSKSVPPAKPVVCFSPYKGSFPALESKDSPKSSPAATSVTRLAPWAYFFLLLFTGSPVNGSIYSFNDIWSYSKSSLS